MPGQNRDESRTMVQTAPYPHALDQLVENLRFRRDQGWQVFLVDDYQRDKPGRHHGESRGLTLIVTRVGPDTYHPERIIAVNHLFAVPPATYNMESWRMWLFERLLSVDKHECMEDFAFATADKIPGDSVTESVERPYAPNHGPGWDPYLITVVTTSLDRATSFRGEVKPEAAPRRAPVRAFLGEKPCGAPGCECHEREESFR